VKRLFFNITVTALALMRWAAHAATGRFQPHSNCRGLTHNLTHDVVNFLGFGADQANNPTDPSGRREPRTRTLGSGSSQGEICRHEFAPMAVADAAPPRLPSWTRPAPSVETPLHRLFCVEYARMRSGLAVFGDARHWWDRAKNLYARLPHPVEEA